MDHLLQLQTLQLNSRKPAAMEAEIEKLRTEVPSPLLGHFDRLIARGKKGVAFARNGVCSECHLQITGAKLVILSAATDIQLCDNCGRYLCLAEQPAAALPDQNPESKPRRRKTKAAA